MSRQIVSVTQVAEPSHGASQNSRAQKRGAMIGAMNDQLIIKPDQSIPAEPDCITAATREGRMLSGKEVAAMLGYKNRASFWSFCAREGVPLCRLSSHTIRFPVVPLQAWIEKRSNTRGRL